MKKSILLATTAIVSVFALSANAADANSNVNVTIKGKVTILPTFAAYNARDLDFGKIGSPTSECHYTLGLDGEMVAPSTQLDGSYCAYFGSAQLGRIHIGSTSTPPSLMPQVDTDWVTNPLFSKLSYVATQNITLSSGDTPCGTIEDINFSASPIYEDGKHYVEYGGTFKPAKGLRRVMTSNNEALNCVGTGTATLVFNDE